MNNFDEQNANFWQNEANNKATENIDLSNLAHIANMDKINAEKQAIKAREEAINYSDEVDHVLEVGVKLAEHLEQKIEELNKAHATIAALKNSLATWIVDSKTYREVASHLAVKHNVTTEYITNLEKQSKSNVLNNQTSYGNNAQDVAFLNPYVENIKKTLN